MYDETLRSTPGDPTPGTSPVPSRRDARPLTVAALYPDLGSARAAIDDLVGGAPGRDDDLAVSVIASDNGDCFLRHVLTQEPDAPDLLGTEDSDRAAALALRRALGTVSRRSVSGVGTIVVAGPVRSHWQSCTQEHDSSTIARSSDLICVFERLGIPKAEGEAYTEGLRQGSTLVLVGCTGARCDAVVEALDRHEPFDIEKTLVRWVREGWMSFERRAHPLSARALRAERRHDAQLRPGRTTDAVPPSPRRPLHLR